MARTNSTGADFKSCKLHSMVHNNLYAKEFLSRDGIMTVDEAKKTRGLSHGKKEVADYDNSLLIYFTSGKGAMSGRHKKNWPIFF